MSGLKLHKKSTGYHLTRNGKKVGTPIPKMTMAFEWTYITLDIDAVADLMVVGDFLLLISDSTPICMHSQKSIHLCFFEGELTQHWRGDEKIWDQRALLFYPDSYGNDTTFGELQAAASGLQTFKGAIYLPMNPGVSCKHDYDTKDFVDMTSKGRWLFPHPDGSRAAYEHMKKTTLEDDLERLMPHFDTHPELMETFADLI